MKKKEFVEAICTILDKKGVLSHKDAVALKKNYDDRSQTSFDDFLLAEGLVEKEDLLDALSSYYQVPFMDPIGYFFDHYLITRFPKDFLLRNLILPVEVLEDAILVVVANDPSDEELLPALGNYVSYDIQFMVGIASEIIESVEEFYDKSLTDLGLDDTVILESEKEIKDEARELLDETYEEE